MKIMIKYWVANSETLRSTAVYTNNSNDDDDVVSIDGTRSNSTMGLDDCSGNLFNTVHIEVCRNEVHFWLNGYVNKQNCRIWSDANPQVYVEPPLHPEKLTVWCALWAGGILLQNR
ncbi:hypothetical protein TNCV_3834971 [Trichonephila clavipes]|nr:hypothetical protein TNCV_3834971 [Trichonephila clavipes]